MSRSCDRPRSAAVALTTALVIALLAWPRPAAAHQASIAHSTVRVQPGQSAVDYELVLSSASAAEPCWATPSRQRTDRSRMQRSRECSNRTNATSGGSSLRLIPAS